MTLSELLHNKTVQVIFYFLITNQVVFDIAFILSAVLGLIICYYLPAYDTYDIIIIFVDVLGLICIMLQITYQVTHDIMSYELF